MTNIQKPKEWILQECYDYDQKIAMPIDTTPSNYYCADIHVIEYSAVEALREKLAIAIKVLSERCCIDDCGFDVENESRETLRDCLKAIDLEAREALAKLGER